MIGEKDVIVLSSAGRSNRPNGGGGGRRWIDYLLIALLTGNSVAKRGREGGRIWKDLISIMGQAVHVLSKMFLLNDRDMVSWLRCSPYGITYDQDMISWD